MNGYLSRFLFAVFLSSAIGPVLKASDQAPALFQVKHYLYKTHSETKFPCLALARQSEVVPGCNDILLAEVVVDSGVRRRLFLLKAAKDGNGRACHVPYSAEGSSEEGFTLLMKKSTTCHPLFMKVSYHFLSSRGECSFDILTLQTPLVCEPAVGSVSAIATGMSFDVRKEGNNLFKRIDSDGCEGITFFRTDGRPACHILNLQHRFASLDRGQLHFAKDVSGVCRWAWIAEILHVTAATWHRALIMDVAERSADDAGLVLMRPVGEEGCFEVVKPEDGVFQFVVTDNIAQFTGTEACECEVLLPGASGESPFKFKLLPELLAFLREK